MADDKKSKKRCFVEISSSDESKSSLLESDDDAVEEISSSTSCEDDEYDDDGTEWNHSEDEEGGAQVDEAEDCDEDAHVDKDDAESMCNRVIRFMQGGSDLHELKLNECKVYLRRHNLRLSGNKEECLERIKEHWKLKDGNAEVLYPRSSFVIDCTGDVCKGDIVLFHQKVYQISRRMTKSRSLGRRTVAGRIVKESYGAAKQQHTFTVEVLWSRGTKKLDPLFPLLVKGRNLYKMKTFRQPWKNEKERLEVLSEKHRRGAVARTMRAMRMSKAATKTNRSLTYKGAKHCKHFHHLDSSRTRNTTHAKKNHLNDHEVLTKSKKRVQSQSFSRFSSKQNGGFKGSASRRRHRNLIQSNPVRECPSLPYNYPSQTFYNFQSDVFPTELHDFHSNGGSAFMAGPPYSHPLPYSGVEPISERKEFSHGSSFDPGYSHSKNGYEARSLNRFHRLMNKHPSFYSTTDRLRWK